MRLLIFNCGSSSLKFAVFEAFKAEHEALSCLGRGTVDPIGGPASVRFSAKGQGDVVREEDIPDHDALPIFPKRCGCSDLPGSPRGLMRQAIG